MRFNRFLAPLGGLLTIVVLGLLLGDPAGAVSSQTRGQEGDTLVVYVYDSFVSSGAADVVVQAFQERSDVPVQFVATGPSREMLARLLTERDAGSTPADIFLGELNDVPKAKRFDLFEPLSEEDVPNLQFVPEELQIDPDGTLLPYEHGFIDLVYDTQALGPEELPHTFPELLDERFRGKLLVQDPRTSSTGHAFLFWTIYNYGEDFTRYWEELLPNILSIFPGWSASYQAFQKGEAPIMVSFSTDGCFDARFQPLFLEGQAYRTIFGAGVVKGTDNPQSAREFIDTLLSTKVQEQLPNTEFMFPANAEAQLPEAWKTCALVPPAPAVLPLGTVAENDDRWLQAWAEIVVGR